MWHGDACVVYNGPHMQIGKCDVAGGVIKCHSCGIRVLLRAIMHGKLGVLGSFLQTFIL